MRINKICNSDVTNEDGISVERTVQGDNGSKLVGSSYREESGLIVSRGMCDSILKSSPGFLAVFTPSSDNCNATVRRPKKETYAEDLINTFHQGRSKKWQGTINTPTRFFIQDFYRSRENRTEGLSRRSKLLRGKDNWKLGFWEKRRKFITS